MSKVSVVGAGYVGEIAAFRLVQSEIVDEIALIDIIDLMPQGKGLDMKEASPIIGSDTKIYGTNNYSELEGSDIVVITAGVPRKPGMDRIQLLDINIKICRSVVENIVKYAPDSMICYVANPVDVLTFAAQKISGFSTNKVFGMAGILDTTRYRAFISMEAKVSVRDIKAMVLGGHGDSMVPLPRFTTIGGIPLSNFLSNEKIEAIVERTKKGGGEIVSLFKNVPHLGSAYYAPGSAVAEMIEAIIRDQRRVLPVVAYLNNKYGFSNVYAGAPVILGRNGVEEVLEIELNDEELNAYKTSILHVQRGIEELLNEKLL